MKKKQSYRMTLRFKKWSRKAYAAFVSLGRCVTIGCLSKSVADSSLKKQKAGVAAGCKSSVQGYAEENDGKGQETDIGVPMGCGNALGTVLEICGFGVPQVVLCPINEGGQRDNNIVNSSGTRMTRAMQGVYKDFASSASFFIREVKELTPLTPQRLKT